MKSQEFITEATYELDADVDMLYDLAFKDIVTSIQQGTWTGKLPPSVLGSTSMLISPEAKKAHELNPADIITTRENSYNPDGNIKNNPYISIAINDNVIKLIRQEGGLKNALQLLPPHQRSQFKQEITQGRIKGSIHHELAHWLDDTLHNSHIKNRINKARNAKSDVSSTNIMNQGKKQRNLSDYEINAQIHSIKQLKRENESMWNLLSFDEMVELNSSLINLSNTFKDMGVYDNWKKTLLRRMYRENLLGEEMYRTL